MKGLFKIKQNWNHKNMKQMKSLIKLIDELKLL